MEADDLLCSRNARLKKALVGRAQWKINQPPSRKRERARVPGTQCGATWLAIISRSSISNTSVAPGLMRGGRPLSR
jgi:hypothetical protein